MNSVEKCCADPSTDVFALQQASWRVGAAVAQLRTVAADPGVDQVNRLLADAQALLTAALAARGLALTARR
jgi:hypothetical protein